MHKRVDFLYLSEKDMLEAGVSDMHGCIKTMIEMFQLIAEGDYIMGGKNCNSHGQKLFFPEKSKFENMPVKGPDRRFMCLMAYLGGRFNVCGQKWYGSNIGNKEKNLPRSILTVMLNDADTGAPLCLMSANILSAVRTGAIAGVGSKFLARDDAEVLGLIGCGEINRTSALAILDVCRNIKEVKVFSRYAKSAGFLCSEIAEKFGIKAVFAEKLENAVRDSDIICVASAGDTLPIIEEEWMKEGVLLAFQASANLDKDFMLRTKIVIDNWKMYEAYAQEWDRQPGGYSQNLPGIIGDMMEYALVEKSLSAEKMINLSDLITGKTRGRESRKEKIILIMDGMPTEDVAWGYEVYQNALKQEIGVKINLF